MANKKETRAKLAPIAKGLFDSNRGIDTLHLCANGQGYTDKERAAKYAEQFDDDSVYTFEREKKPSIDTEKAKKAAVKAELAKQQNAFDYEKVDKELLEDRDFLMARYEALEGKKAPANIKNETLVEKVKALEVSRFGIVEK